MPCATGSNSHNFTVLAAEAGTIFCTRCGEIRRALPAAGPQSSRRSSASAAVQQEPSLHHHPLPYGTIVLWSNSYDTIPDGWQLCDGTNGTPDLRDRFVVGAEGNYPPHVTGGATHHTLQANHMPLHDHRRDQSRRREYPIVEYMLPPGIASERVVRFEHVQVGHNEEPRRVWMMHHEPETYTAPEGLSPPDPIDLRPPFYALAYIMHVVGNDEDEQRNGTRAKRQAQDRKTKDEQGENQEDTASNKKPKTEPGSKQCS